jgi:hypothetical protein
VFWLSALARNHALLESSYMSSWSIRSQTVLRVTLALVTTMLPLLLIVGGGAELLRWFQVHQGNQYYYLEYWTLKDAKWFLLVGMIGMLPAGLVLFRRQARLRWLWLSLLVPLFMIWYPNMITFEGGGIAHVSAHRQVRHQLARFAIELRHATEQGNPWHCTSEPTTTLSPYGRAGERLFYQRVCVAADRPRASLLASSAPGTIYIATSPDEKVAWLMATVLPQNSSETVHWLQDRNGEPLVLTDLSLSEKYLRRAD